MSKVDPKALIKAAVAQVTVAEHEGRLVGVAIAYVTDDGQARWTFGYADKVSVPLLGAMQLLQTDIDQTVTRDRKPVL